MSKLWNGFSHAYNSFEKTKRLILSCTLARIGGKTQKNLTKVSLAIGDGASIPMLKTVLNWRGIKAGGCRSPLRSMSSDDKRKLKESLEKVLKEVGLKL